MICMKIVRFSSRLRAKVRCQGPPGSARGQPCNDGDDGSAVVLGDDKDNDDDNDNNDDDDADNNDISRGYHITVELIN